MTNLDAIPAVRLLGNPLWRWIGGIIVIAVLGAWAFDEVRDIAVGNQHLLEDHTQRLGNLKTRMGTLEIQLADGSNAAQSRTDARVRAVEDFIGEQRSFNARVTEQNRQSNESIKDIQTDMRGMRKDLGEVNGNIKGILDIMRERERERHGR